MDYVSEGFSSSGICLETEVPQSMSCILDMERMVRVLVNLLDNARKASARGSSVKLEVQEAASGAVFIIADQGEGMSEEVRRQMFEPFYSSSASGGTGLGMVVVKNVIEAHRGRLEVESTPGRGTRITMSVPCRT